MLNRLFGYFSLDLGIDLGTANTLVYVKEKGILIREPSVVAIHKKTKEIIAVGSEAKRMLGKTPSLISVVRPLRDGVISDFAVTEKMLEYYISKVHEIPSRFPRVPRPVVVMGVPGGVTSVERKAVIDAATNAGARKVYLVEEPMLSAIGAGVNVELPRGVLVVDIGGGTTEIAVISLNGIVLNKSLKIAGNTLDMDIIDFARAKHNMLLGEKSAEDIKVEIGSAYAFEGENAARFQMRGRDLKAGLPKSVEVNPFEIRDALKPSLQLMTTAIKDVIEQTPAELVSDILKGGVLLTGGGALLKGLNVLLSKELNVAVHVAPDPITCVVRGCGKLLEEQELLDRVKIS
ncbi:rod shape-determining protein [Patescibacteria group bacterium]|nr:rod shape-determining protein [Patescibacteria group bacterium]